MSGVLVLTEHRDGKLDGLTLQLLNVARSLADQLRVELVGLVLGKEASGVATAVSGLGVDRVLLADDTALEPYNAEIFCNLICDTIQQTKPQLVILGYTYLGIEIGPAISVRLGAPLASNCIGLELVEGKIVVTRPAYGGSVNTRVEVQGEPVVISLQRGSSQGLKTGTRQAAPISRLPVNIQADQLKTKVIKAWKAAEGEVDITKAELIVSLGRGIAKNKDAALELARKLAVALGGTVACSRPVADVGWLPDAYHVGMSGKTVTPKVYLACGISGALQHVAGMRDSQVIIAVNKDPAAPIFQIAHYGVVRDLFEVLPNLIEEAQKK